MADNKTSKDRSEDIFVFLAESVAEQYKELNAILIKQNLGVKISPDIVLKSATNLVSSLVRGGHINIKNANGQAEYRGDNNGD